MSQSRFLSHVNTSNLTIYCKTQKVLSKYVVHVNDSHKEPISEHLLVCQSQITPVYKILTE